MKIWNDGMLDSEPGEAGSMNMCVVGKWVREAGAWRSCLRQPSSSAFTGSENPAPEAPCAVHTPATSALITLSWECLVEGYTFPIGRCPWYIVGAQ